ncbi:MAG: CAP domain-containing protein [Devosia sp.]
MVQRYLILTLMAAVLAGCGFMGIGGDKPATTVPKVARERTVNPAEATRLINAYRKSRGRPQLIADPRLSAIAAKTARELARRDRLKTELHTSQGLARRLNGARYPAERAAENLGAGYPTLVLAIDGWKGSSKHNRNLLRRDMTHMGIGLAVTDKGIFQSYWVLLLATPDGEDEPA